MGRFAQNPHASSFIDGLRKELETVRDPHRRLPILYALIRVLERRPGNREEVAAALDEAVALNPNLPDLAFEAWRGAANRLPEHKIDALKGLLPHLDDPKDRINCRLLLSELHANQKGETTAVNEALRAAEEELEECREVLWARAFIGGEVEDRPLARRLETLSTLTTDPVLEASLLLEAAAVLSKEPERRGDAGTLLSRVLESPELDWSLLSAIYRLAILCGREDLAPICLQRLADAAKHPPYDRAADETPGHRFPGFDGGTEQAAAYEWFRSVVERKLLKDPAAAKAALMAAIELTPDSPFLTIEKALLEEAADTPRKAFETALVSELPKGRIGLIALAAGRPEEALRLGAAAREASPGGLLGQALMDATAETNAPPSSTASPEVKLAWLEANLAHEAAPGMAEALEREGVSRPYFTLFREESRTRAQSILDIATGVEEAPWVHLWNGILGDPEQQGDGFIKLSDATEDPILKAIALKVGAAFKADAGDQGAVLDKLRRQAETFAAAKELPEIKFVPTEEGFKTLLDALGSEDDDETRYKKALINLFALDDPAAALEAMRPLATPKQDTATLLLGIDGAARSGDWQIVLERMAQLSHQAGPKPTPLFDLVLGELFLIVSREYGKALECFDRAGGSLDPDVADLAAIYRIVTLHQLDDNAAIEKTMTAPETSPEPSPLSEDIFGGLFDDEEPLEPRARKAIKQLEGYGADTPQQWIAKLAFTTTDPAHASPDVTGIAKGLTRLAEIAGDEKGQGFRIAAALLENRPYIPGTLTDIEPEAHYYTDTYLAETEDAPAKPFAALKSEQPHAPEDPDWLDLMLDRAETEAEAGDAQAALDTLHRALVSAPDHPGLLESLAAIAYGAERFVEAADAHGRLAGFYVSEEAMTHHLAQAALILYDKLDNPEGARKICREALRRSPEHAKLNDIITHIMEACALLPEIPSSSAPVSPENTDGNALSDNLDVRADGDTREGEPE